MDDEPAKATPPTISNVPTLALPDENESAETRTPIDIPAKKDEVKSSNTAKDVSPIPPLTLPAPTPALTDKPLNAAEKPAEKAGAAGAVKPKTPSRLPQIIIGDENDSNTGGKSETDLTGSAAKAVTEPVPAPDKKSVTAEPPVSPPAVTESPAKTGTGAAPAKRKMPSRTVELIEN
jgi:hypothetical protein